MYDSHAPGKQSFKSSSPVCHDFGVSSLLLVGLVAGEVHLIDPFHKEVCKVFNEEKYIERTAVTCVRWVPYSTNQFLVAHASGHMYLYNEELPCCPTPPVFQQFKKGVSFVVYTCKTKSTCNPLYNWALTNMFSESPLPKVFDDCDVSTASLPSINQFSFSTCGKYLAVVTEDGFLRVFDYHRMHLYGFMRSYFGGLTCVDWSPDGKYVVVGGQDDLITIWSFTAQAVICRGQGHKSWTSVVRFDPFVYSPSLCNGASMMGDFVSSRDPENPHVLSNSSSSGLRSLSTEVDSTFRTYRLGSVGQDTFLCLWELTEDIIRQGLRFSSHYHNSTTDGRHHLASISSTGCSADAVDGLEKSRTMPRSGAAPGKRKSFLLSSFRSPLLLSSRHSDRSDVSGKSSVLSESGYLPPPADLRLPDGTTGSSLLISARDLLGTPNCPRLSDVPILEPFAKFGITRDLITDLVFREDSINLAFQQGVILTFTRPVDHQHPEACVATGDLSNYDASNLIESRGDGVDDDDGNDDDVGDDEDDEGEAVDSSPVHLRGSPSSDSTVACSPSVAASSSSYHRLPSTIKRPYLPSTANFSWSSRSSFAPASSTATPALANDMPGHAFR
ncbi:unnamed protein product [Mesocestoides corti]|nr:unnamed protein product [Mesocestoides corti]